MDALIAEDLLLLLLDDEKGTVASSRVDVRTPLAAAVLAELGMLGAVDLEPGSLLVSAKLHATGVLVTDPVLARVLAVVAEKPRTPGSLIERIKKGLQEELATRLAGAKLIERREGKVLGIFPRTTWPTVDAEHERAVRDHLADVLLRDADPDPRTAVLAGILGALEKAHTAIDAKGSDAATAKRRAKAIAKGDWATDAVTRAVQATMTAVLTPMIATAVITSD